MTTLTNRPWAGRRLHLVGLGGAGMSGYARAAVALGATVSGSDRAESAGLEELRALGVDAHVGHAAANVPAGRRRRGRALDARSRPRTPSAPPPRERGLPDRPRAALLAELSALKRTIAIAGAHGKTTTILDGGTHPAALRRWSPAT